MKTLDDWWFMIDDRWFYKKNLTLQNKADEPVAAQGSAEDTQEQATEDNNSQPDQQLSTLDDVNIVEFEAVLLGASDDEPLGGIGLSEFLKPLKLACTTREFSINVARLAIIPDDDDVPEVGLEVSVVADAEVGLYENLFFLTTFNRKLQF